MALRTIDTDGLKSLGAEGCGPWRLPDGRLLRTSRDMVPLQTEFEAREMFDTYHAARLAGAPTPDALEIVRVPSGYGVIVEYVYGLALGMHLLFGSYSAEEAGRAMAELARRLHALHMDAGCDWGAAFTQRVYTCAPLLEPKLGRKLISLVEAIPASDALIHGDLHLANIVVLKDACLPIDMESAGFGHPTFDLAIAHSRLIGSAKRLAVQVGVAQDVSERASRRVWTAFLQSYFEGVSEVSLADLDRRFEILADAEICHQICTRGGIEIEQLKEGQDGRLTAYVQRMEELLPHVTRLDF